MHVFSFRNLVVRWLHMKDYLTTSVENLHRGLAIKLLKQLQKIENLHRIICQKQVTDLDIFIEHTS